MSGTSRRWADTFGCAEHIATTPTHVRELARKGSLPAHRLGRLLRFDLDEVDRALDSAPLEKAS